VSRRDRVVSFEEGSRKAFAAAVIVLAHGVAFYAFSLLSPRLEQAIAAVPVSLSFIEQAESPPRWEPPRVSVVSPAVVTQAPQMPLIDIPAAQTPAERAITIAVQPPPPASATAERSTPKLVSAVEYVRQPIPRYPPQSRRLREQGVVVLRVEIDEQGTACSIEIETSSGHARLDEAAREAVARAAFRPYMEGGTPRRALVLIPIEFSLNRSTV
jgi:periplasmic protein TonB